MYFYSKKSKIPVYIPAKIEDEKIFFWTTPEKGGVSNKTNYFSILYAILIYKKSNEVFSFPGSSSVIPAWGAGSGHPVKAMPCRAASRALTG